MAKVFVFVPAFGRQITTTTFEATHELMSALASKGIYAGIGSFSWPDIEEVRNVVLSWWYDATDYTHLLFVDADMGFPAQMVIDMLTFGEPMVGAIYRKKCAEVEWVASGGLKDPQFRNGFIEVEGLGMGCFLIRRDAIAPMIEKFPEKIYPYIAIADFRWQGPNRTLAFFDQMRIPEGKVSEDISFCRRYREAGGTVWATTAYTTVHEGAFQFAGCFAKEREMDMKQAEIDKRADALMEPRKTVKAKHGTFIVNPNDTFIGRSLIEYGEWCEFEIDLLRWAVTEGDTVIDVGANIGTHAIAFADMVGPNGRVIAFEPQPRLAEMLRDNVRSNDLGDVIEVIQDAAGDSRGNMLMADLPPDTAQFNFGAVPLTGPALTGQMCEVHTIDSLGTSPTLIKIDVEGMEMAVIRGAVHTIERCKPVLYFECNSDAPLGVEEQLDRINYRAFWSIGPYFNPNNHFRNPKDVWPNVMPSVNLIAIHSSAASGTALRGLPRYLGGDDNWRKALERQFGGAAARTIAGQAAE